jgi:hypothetical protein
MTSDDRTNDQTGLQTAYRRLMLAVGIAMLGFAVPFAIANYKTDQCHDSLQLRLDDVKAKLDANTAAPRPR